LLQLIFPLLSSSQQSWRRRLPRYEAQLRRWLPNFLHKDRNTTKYKNVFIIFFVLVQGCIILKWLNVVEWHLIFVGPQSGTCFMSPCGTYNFEAGPRFLEKFMNPPHHIGGTQSVGQTSKAK